MIDIKNDFEKFLQQYGERAYERLSLFFDQEKEKFYHHTIQKLIQQNTPYEEAIIKTRQSWVTTIGRHLEIIIEKLLQPLCQAKNIRMTNDKILKSTQLNQELSLVKRALLIDFGEYALLPDSDIVLYQKSDQIKVLAIISIKNSFRERYTETPYWKLKLLQHSLTRHIKYFMVTPDKDSEISFAKRARKARIVMEYELDGIYLAKEEFDPSDKVKSITNLIDDIKALL